MSDTVAVSPFRIYYTTSSLFFHNYLTCEVTNMDKQMINI